MKEVITFASRDSLAEKLLPLYCYCHFFCFIPHYYYYYYDGRRGFCNTNSLGKRRAGLITEVKVATSIPRFPLKGDSKAEGSRLLRVRVRKAAGDREEGEWGGMGTIMEVNLEKMRKREGEGNCAQILKLGRYGRKHYEER